jgi:hypothetical protein
MYLRGRPGHFQQRRPAPVGASDVEATMTSASSLSDNGKVIPHTLFLADDAAPGEIDRLNNLLAGQMLVTSAGKITWTVQRFAPVVPIDDQPVTGKVIPH